MLQSTLENQLAQITFNEFLELGICLRLRHVIEYSNLNTKIEAMNKFTIQISVSNQLLGFSYLDLRVASGMKVAHFNENVPKMDFKAGCSIQMQYFNLSLQNDEFKYFLLKFVLPHLVAFGVCFFSLMPHSPSSLV